MLGLLPLFALNYLCSALGTLRYEDGKARMATAVDAGNLAGPVVSPKTKCLRAIDSKYGESNDSSENSDFLLLRQKDPSGELFSEIYFKSSSELTFF